MACNINIGDGLYSTLYFECRADLRKVAAVCVEIVGRQKGSRYFRFLYAPLDYKPKAKTNNVVSLWTMDESVASKIVTEKNKNFYHADDLNRLIKDSAKIYLFGTSVCSTEKPSYKKDLVFLINNNNHLQRIVVPDKTISGKEEICAKHKMIFATEITKEELEQQKQAPTYTSVEEAISPKELKEKIKTFLA